VQWWFTSIIPATWEMQIGRSEFKVSLGKKRKIISETLSQRTSQVWCHISIIPAIHEPEVGEYWLEISPGQKTRSF
jgi:hypothetical protein